MKYLNIFLVFLMVPIGTRALSAGSPIQMEVSDIVFYPERWTEAGLDFTMFAWEGRHITFLTLDERYHPEKMASFVKILDKGWKAQRDLMGASPQPYRELNGKPTICAVPTATLTCGYGCGYVGATGIEVSAFYERDWPAYLENPEAFAHYYFYEMARNFYTFGDRHSIFTTGVAVFMRYVCMDIVGCKDPDLETRHHIERCEELYAISDLPFFTAFTHIQLNEKENRLKDRHGNLIPSTDQCVLYAAAMLFLRKEYGGDDWVKSFFHHLGTCDEFNGNEEANVMSQCLNWLVCASLAAGQDLTPVFVDRWRMPLRPEQARLMKQTNWKEPGGSAQRIVSKLLQSEE